MNNKYINKIECYSYHKHGCYYPPPETTISKIFRLIYDFCIDDIWIYSISKAEHEELLRLEIKTLRKEQLKIVTAFWLSKMSFPAVSSERIYLDS